MALQGMQGVAHSAGSDHSYAVMTTRSVKIIPVCNTDFFTKSPKFGLYLVCILRKSLYFHKLEIKKKTVRGTLTEFSRSTFKAGNSVLHLFSSRSQVRK